MATCVAQPEFEEIGISYSVTENYFVTPNKIKSFWRRPVSRLGSCNNGNRSL